jgi:superfamily II DNA or RNA helicase
MTEENVFFESDDFALEEEEDNVFFDSEETHDEDYNGIELLPHQKHVIQYIVSKCRKQKGLLVSHLMGTGKTITGIFFLKNFKKYKKVIIAPAALKSMWKKACMDNNISQGVQFITYEYLESLQEEDIKIFTEKMEMLQNITKDSVVISDESHNLLEVFDFCQKMGSQSLTIINRMMSPQARLEAQRDNEDVIMYKNRLAHYLKVFEGCKKILFLTGTPVLDTLEDIRWYINLAAGSTVVPYNMQDFTDRYLVQNHFYKTLEKIVKPIMQIFNIDGEAFERKFSVEDFKSNITTLIDKVLLGRLTGNVIIDQTIKTVLTNTILKNIRLFKERFTINKFDVNKVDWGKYISYYRYENLDYYPTMNISTSAVTYTDYQYDVWYRAQNHRLSYEECVDLMFNSDVEDAKLFKPYYTYMNTERGRIFGNLGANPEKFVGIKNDYLKHNLSTLVYSNFYESGILLLSKYLKGENIEHTVFHPDLSSEEKENILKDFKEQKIKLVLLHPAYFEGFSIQGVRRFHVLEPVRAQHYKEQLYTRVVRFKSHDHLPKEERNVEIIQWYCTFQSVIDKARKIKLQIQNLDIDLEQLNFDGSPDDTLMEEGYGNESILNNLASTLRQISIENNEKLPQNVNDEKCCIYGTICPNETLPKCEDLEDL